METPGSRLKAVREAAGFETAKDAALKMGVPIATYSQHEKAAQHLPARRAAEYAAFFGVSPEYLLFARGDAAPTRVPLINELGGFTEKTVGLPRSASKVTRAQVSPELLGFVAIYDEPQTSKAPPDIDGRMCVVSINTPNLGETRLVRIVRRGSSPGRFHLIAAYVPAEPLFDHEILWAAPVIALLPSAA